MSIGTVISSEDKPRHSASITWTIDGFRYRFNSIDSPLIKLSTGSTFELTLVPVCIVNNIEYLTVSLYSSNAKDLSSWLSIVKANGNKCFTQANPHVEDSLFRRADVLKEANGYLVDGKLTVHCKVICKDKVADNGKHSAGDNVASALLLSLLEGAKYSDATLVVGGKEFHVHKNILATRSPVFDAMFSQEFREKMENKVEIPDVSVEVFELLLRGIYTGRLLSLEKHAEELLAVANKYQVDDLKIQCTQSLIRSITTESAISLLLLADMHQSGELKSECIKYIAANLTSVQATEGWKHLEEIGPKHCDLLFDLLKAVAK